MITPTVGRVVWYRPKAEEVGEAGLTLDGSQRLAAIVAFVHSPESVNLGVLTASGDIVGRVSVPLAQDSAPGEGEAEWMPFQKGQAAKAEQLERKLEEQPKASEPALAAAPVVQEPALQDEPAASPSVLDQLAQPQG